MLGRALMASRWKIIVFLGVIISICIIMGTLMYIIEGDLPREQGEGFTSIPRSIYWAIVTLILGILLIIVIQRRFLLTT